MKYKKYIILLATLSLSSLFGANSQTPSNEANYTLIKNESSYSILTPSLKDRKTAKIRLKNGLEAYLVSDPEIDQSAAAVSIEAGSWQDPSSYPGMAHFLEHMLFMGSKAYPDEAEYMRYIQDNGGTVNAFTASDRTVYMFSINNAAFTGALDRFSHFFIDPLFNPSSINRELHAVDQENSKNLENDFWRQYMVLKETGTENHPHTKFGTGNANTLSGIPQEALKDWFKTHYGANKTHLVMLSSLPLEEMIQLANKDFSAVPVQEEKELSIPYEPMLSEKQKGHFVYVSPIQDIKLLSIIWELPKAFTSVNEKWTVELLSYMLTEASENSLVKELKKEQLAEDIQVTVDRFSRDNILFTINIKLTDKGLSQVDTAILRCFQTLARLKQNGVPISLFQEIKTMAEINYQYQIRQEPFSWITDIAYNIVDENISSFPEKTEVPSEFNPQAFHDLLCSFTPESATYFILANPLQTGVSTTLREKWMDVPYTIKSIPPAKIAAWQQASPYLQMGITPANPFIPDSLTLVQDENDLSTYPTPTRILHKSKYDIYFAKDNKYQVPEASLIFSIKTPVLNGSAKAAITKDLFCKVLDEDLSPTLFFASQAGLNISCSTKEMGLSLSISGFSQRAPDVALTVLAALKNIQCSEERFLTYKASLLSNYANSALELPAKQAMYTMSSILLNNAPSPEDKLEALQALSFEEFSNFSNTWLNSIYVEGMIYGNLTKENVASFLDNLQEIFASSSEYENPKQEELLILPSQGGPFKITQKTDRQGNGALLVVEQGSFSFAKEAAQQLSSKALSEAFFDTLRTKQQTGYIAKSWASEVSGELFQTFIVQSSSHVPEDLLNRFELFIEDFNKRLMDFVPKERFEHMKEVEIASIERPPENLYGMANLLNTLAFEKKGDFSWQKEQVQAINELTYETFLKDVHNFFSKDNHRRLAVLVEGISSKRSFTYTSCDKEEIRKLSSFTSISSEQ